MGLAVLNCTTLGANGKPVPRRSEMILHCNESDAEVKLDGVPQGICDDYDGTPRGLLLSKGGHMISVQKSGFTSWNTFIEADTTRVVMNVILYNL
jgi:hypothetical protein